MARSDEAADIQPLGISSCLRVFVVVVSSWLASRSPAPVSHCRVSDGAPIFCVDTLETCEKGHSVARTAQERQRAQHSADAQEVMISGRQPEPASFVVVGAAHDFDRIADCELEAVELQHELK